MKRWIRALACFVLLLGLAPGSAQGRAGVPRGRIIFSRYNPGTERIGRSGIYSIRPDGSGLTRLSHQRDFQPVWSPGHDHIAFLRIVPVEFPTGTSYEQHLYVMSDDGSDAVLISDNIPSSQVWSPVADRLAYYDAGDIWVTDPGGANKEKVTEDPRLELEVSWSPTGDHLSFRRSDTIYVVDLATGEEREVFAESDGYLYETHWSPDGSHIAFTSTKGHFEGEDGPYSNDIWVVDSDGSRPRQLTDDCHWDQDLEWLDADTILYAAIDDDDGCLEPKETEIQTVDLAGEVTNLTRNRKDESRPVASPNGSWIAYERFVRLDKTTWDSRIWIMRADGTNPRPVSGGYPRWFDTEADW